MSDRLSEPPDPTFSKKYADEYDKLTADDILTAKEMDQLDASNQAFLAELAQPENASNSTNYIISRKGIIIPILAFLWFFLAKKGPFNRKDKLWMIVSVALIVSPSFFMFYSANLLETSFYAGCFILGVFKSKSKDRPNNNTPLGVT